MKTEPLPPIQQDPAWLAAKQVHVDHAAALERIQADGRLSEVGKAERVEEARAKSNAELQRLADDLTRRRSERLADLQSRLPIGPDIDENTSPADAAVLHRIFRQTLDTARGTPPKDLPAKLAEAQRYGDVTAARAILTAAFEDPVHHSRTVEAYAADHPDCAEAMKELPLLRGTDWVVDQFQRQVFHEVDRPWRVAQAPITAVVA